ncbi:MAG: sensor domain-containing phosphodiesterase, partial [Anaerovorax sp.]
MLEFLNMLDELSELVYVVDLETYDLLFMNTTGQKNFGISNVKGHKCYRMLHGKESPCEFCTNPFLSFDTFYTWEITNETVHRHYLLKDKLIQWHGRTARLEIAFDTTEQELQKKVLQNTLMRETFILDCLKILCGKRDFSHALNQVLKIAGEFFGSDRTYIFETCKTGIAYTYEWCAEGISSQICTHPLIPQEWPHLFAPHECIVLEENKGICYNNPKIYEALKEAKVQRAILAPLLSDGVFMGYVGTDNPPAENVETAKLQLETLGYFISAGLQRQRDKTLLETLSYCDTLTHTLNWNAY